MIYYFCPVFKEYGMKKLGILLLIVFGLGLAFQACDNQKTYAEMKEEEREAIRRFIELNNIKVIDEDQFEEQDSTTDVSLNEYVLFKESGVYMQVVNRGGGRILEDGRHEILALYVEEEIVEDGTTDTLSFNTVRNWYPHPDELMVTKSGKSIQGTFSMGEMSSYYGASVPSAWMLPFNYLKVGRSISDRSKIKLIVPHSEGTSTASAQVYPTFYEITYQLAR